MDVMKLIKFGFKDLFLRIYFQENKQTKQTKQSKTTKKQISQVSLVSSTGKSFRIQWTTSLCRNKHNIHNKDGKDSNNISVVDEFFMKALDSISQGDQTTTLKQTLLKIIFTAAKLYKQG